MYDIETPLYQLVYDTVMEVTDGHAEVASTYTKVPERFPMVYFTMVDCYTNNGMRTADHIDMWQTATFDLSVYSNSESGKKAECKRIGNAIDEAFMKKGISRMSWTINPDINDATVYRLTARYRVMFDRDGVLYYRP